MCIRRVHMQCPLARLVFSAVIRLVNAPPAFRIDVVGPDPPPVLLLRPSAGLGPVCIRVMRHGRLGTIDGADRLAILTLDACHVQTPGPPERSPAARPKMTRFRPKLVIALGTARLARTCVRPLPSRPVERPE